MHARRHLAKQLRLDQRPRIKRRIQHRHHLLGPNPSICPSLAPQCPQAPLERGQRRRRNHPCRAIPRHRQPQCQSRSIRPYRIIKTRSPRLGGIPPPAPRFKIRLQRCRAEIGVEIPMSLPAIALCQVHLDMRRWRKGPPDMPSVRRQRHLNIRYRSGCQGDASLHTGHHWRRTNFININHQLPPVPLHFTGANLKRIAALAQRASTPVRHGKPPAGPVGRHVDASVILRIAPPRPAIPR